MSAPKPSGLQYNASEIHAFVDQAESELWTEEDHAHFLGRLKRLHNENKRRSYQSLSDDFAWSMTRKPGHPHLSAARCFVSDEAGSGTTSISDKAVSADPERESQTATLKVPANDAAVPAKSSSEVLVEVPHDIVTNEEELEASEILDHILGHAKDPLRNEWETLWYHGVEPSFQKISYYFPELRSASSTAALGQSISEPTLDISSLKKEDQEIFKREEQLSKNPFAPKNDQDRRLRQERASRARNERERFALLLGLPVFEEYIEQKRAALQTPDSPLQSSQRQVKRQAKFAEKKDKRAAAKSRLTEASELDDEGYHSQPEKPGTVRASAAFVNLRSRGGMSQEESQAAKTSIPTGGAQHRPLVVGLTKPQSVRSVTTMVSSSDAAALNKEIAENVKENTQQAAPSEDSPTAPAIQKQKKEKAPKQPKSQKAAPVAAPTSPALIDLRVGHIIRAIAHPNADSLYVSTIAMGDPEDTEHTQVDEETGKVVRTVCSGLKAYIPLEEMQDRKTIVVANLKPVNMRSIKSAAMVLAASPKQEEGADPHAPDRTVELVQPPEGAEAGDKVYFEGWPYGEGKGPEKQLNPKKKQWEAIQPGFYTSEDLKVGFDASVCEEVDGDATGELVVEGKGVCTVKTLKGAVVR